MTKLINHYSINPEDNPILEQIAACLGGLSGEQQSALAIAALYEGFEPCAVEFDYCSCPSQRFDDCVALLQYLSLLGKLALGRAILEDLAVVEMLGRPCNGKTASESHIQAVKLLT